MKKNKITAIFLAFAMIVTSITAFADDAPVTVKTPEEQMAQVEEYSTYMQKNIIRTYAQILANNYYYGIEDDELLFAVICSMIDEGKLDIDKAIERMIKTLGDEHAEFYTPQEPAY